MPTKTGALARRRDLVEGRVGNLVRLDLRRALDDLRKTPQQGGICVATVGLRVLLLLPQADGQHVLAILRDERDLVLEAVLLAQHGQNVRFEHPGELGGRIGLQVQRDVTSVHEMTPSRSAMNFGAADTSATGAMCHDLLAVSSSATSLLHQLNNTS